MDDHLARMAAAYDAQVEHREETGEPDWRDDIRDDFVSRLPDGAKVLEVGAGVGYTARWFLDQGVDILATDLSPGNVAAIRAKGVPAEVRDMADLGLPDAAVDGVWAASCLMHVPTPDVPGVLTEIGRVLRPGGWFWVGTWGDDPGQEGIWEEDFAEPKRFYAIRTDAAIRSLYEQTFEVVSFATFRPIDEIDWHYQSALLRVPG
jgi:SAM-dependent methyltransferase